MPITTLMEKFEMHEVLPILIGTPLELSIFVIKAILTIRDLSMEYTTPLPHTMHGLVVAY